VFITNQTGDTKRYIIVFTECFQTRITHTVEPQQNNRTPQKEMDTFCEEDNLPSLLSVLELVKKIGKDDIFIVIFLTSEK
jgi:hypothetical protein